VGRARPASPREDALDLVLGPPNLISLELASGKTLMGNLTKGLNQGDGKYRHLSIMSQRDKRTGVVAPLGQARCKNL
jgi:hypothetical protein